MSDLIDLDVKLDPRDIARVTKRLNQWQGAPLAKRVEKAIGAGAALMVRPIRAGAARHHVTGLTERTTRIRKLRKRSGELTAYKVGITTWYGHFPIAGVYGSPDDAYVDRAYQVYGGQVRAFIDEQVIRLA